MKLGKLITSHNGRTRGPKYGEIYTATAGETGYIVGYRSHANPGLGLMGEEHCETLKQAQDRAVQITRW